MKKRTRIWLIIAALICLVGMLGASLVQSNFGKIDVSYHRLSLSEMISGIEANNKAYGKDVEVSFGTAGSAIVFGTATSARVEFKLLVPDGVSEKNPAPAIVLAPGMDDTKEQMYTLFTELARRSQVHPVQQPGMLVDGGLLLHRHAGHAGAHLPRVRSAAEHPAVRCSEAEARRRCRAALHPQLEGERAAADHDGWPVHLWRAQLLPGV